MKIKQPDRIVNVICILIVFARRIRATWELFDLGLCSDPGACFGEGLGILRELMGLDQIQKKLKVLLGAAFLEDLILCQSKFVSDSETFLPAY